MSDGIAKVSSCAAGQPYCSYEPGDRGVGFAGGGWQHGVMVAHPSLPVPCSASDD